MGHPTDCVMLRLYKLGSKIIRLVVILQVSNNIVYPLWFHVQFFNNSGNNTDGKYFVSSNKLSYDNVSTPFRIPLWREKTRTGQVIPIPDVKIVRVVCGANHTVSRVTGTLIYITLAVSRYSSIKLGRGCGPFSKVAILLQSIF